MSTEWCPIRLLLDKIDFEKGTIRLGDTEYPLLDRDFPTILPSAPYELSKEEAELMDQLKYSFLRSEKLQRHIKFLYSKGGLYLIPYPVSITSRLL